MSAQRFDVLAVMEGAARHLWVEGQPVNPHAADLIRARALVAQLMVAADRVVWAHEPKHDGSVESNLMDVLARIGATP